MTEFSRFCAYKKIEPWGDDWSQTAMICAVTNNSEGRKTKTMKLDDFRPVYKKPQTPEEIGRLFGLFAKLQNASNGSKHNRQAGGPDLG